MKGISPSAYAARPCPVRLDILLNEKSPNRKCERSPREDRELRNALPPMRLVRPLSPVKGFVVVPPHGSESDRKTSMEPVQLDTEEQSSTATIPVGSTYLIGLPITYPYRFQLCGALRLPPIGSKLVNRPTCAL